MPKIKRYSIIQSAHHDELAGMVTEKINDGWQPYGNLVFDGFQFFQTIVKYEE